MVKKPNKAKRYKQLTKNEGLLDKAWRKAGHTGGKCEYCYKKEYLNAHHIFGRRNRATRWDINNCCLLCAGCHNFSNVFSAHQTPTIFTEWIIGMRGDQWHNELKQRASTIYKPTIAELEKLLSELKNKHEKVY